MIPNPLADASSVDADVDLVAAAQAGSRDALEHLVARHQRWIYNIVLRMIYDPHDAEDITQEILIKLVTKLSTFEGRSRFRTWLYRLVVNHVLNMKRTKSEEFGWTFEKYGSGLRAAQDEELPDPNSVPVDLQLLVEEAKIGCTTGMLLCLSREQRLVYVLGEIFGVSDTVGAELLDVSRDSRPAESRVRQTARGSQMTSHRMRSWRLKRARSIGGAKATRRDISNSWPQRRRTSIRTPRHGSTATTHFVDTWRRSRPRSKSNAST